MNERKKFEAAKARVLEVKAALGEASEKRKAAALNFAITGEGMAEYTTALTDEQHWASLHRDITDMLGPMLEAANAERRWLDEQPERERRERERAEQEKRRQQIWAHPKNAERLAREAIIASERWQRGLRGELPMPHLPEELISPKIAQRLKSIGLLRAGNPDDGEPFYLATNSSALAEWFGMRVGLSTEAIERDLVFANARIYRPSSGVQQGWTNFPGIDPAVPQD